MKFRLKTVREENKLSQADLSRVLNVSPSTVGMWEQGRREPNYDTLSKLSQFFNVSADYLIGNEKHSDAETIEEKGLLTDYRSLTSEGRKTLLNVLGSLKITHSAAV